MNAFRSESGHRPKVFGTVPPPVAAVADRRFPRQVPSAAPERIEELILYAIELLVQNAALEDGVTQLQKRAGGCQ